MQAACLTRIQIEPHRFNEIIERQSDNPGGLLVPSPLRLVDLGIQAQPPTPLLLGEASCSEN